MNLGFRLNFYRLNLLQSLFLSKMLVTTPEKWDVVTRKSTGDVALSNLVKLLIFDEVHLLHDDRGSVIETLVARTLRQVGLRSKSSNQWPTVDK